MDGKTLARLGAVVFVAVAVTATAIEMARKEDGYDNTAPQVRSAPAHDPLRADLARCSAMGEAGTRDPGCLKIWAENRRRFLGQPASTPSAASVPPASLFPGGANDPAAGDIAPVLPERRAAPEGR
ncbi:putative entry exclusion protein TrbK-alt [Sphingopyxis sp. 113P3]|uniref:putative entry exclusion protein TrbK-alt n=1 Tax=Sphingopyxis sp. (strain 113P3) TaxID=292913 RepID=UPI0006AD2707|nr:putative entry exclusion protein TrbK-alt [Sphingopyxis sp. 113P3]ALC11388.1 hypothetical protein LH20_05415 [Sphingopyxis sp. 113P3]